MAEQSGSSLACQRCGGRFALETIAGEVHCPYCGEARVIDAHLLAELRTYERTVDGHLARADQELQHVAAWSATADSVGWKAAWLPMLLFIGVPVVASLIMVWRSQQGPLSPETSKYFGVGLTVIVNVMALGWVAYAFIKRARVRGGSASAGTKKVACPGCGAANLMQAGQRLTNCTHCDCALIPNAPLIQQGIDAAAQAHRLARIERYRAERLGMLKLMKYSRSARWLPLLGIVPVVLGLVVSLGMVTAQMTNGQMAFHPGIYIAWSSVAAVLAVAVAWRSHSQRRKLELRDALATLASQLGGQSSTKLDHAVGWLNHYWPEAYKTQHIHASAHYGWAAGFAHGYPVFVEVSLAATDKYRGPRVHVIVAAMPEGAPPQSERRRANLLESAIESAGFDLRRKDGGLISFANDALIKQIRKEPESLLALSAEINRMTQLCAALQAGPGQRLD